MEVFAHPNTIETPVINFSDFDKWEKDNKRYIKELKKFCIDEGQEKNDYVGKIARFQVADGYAEYMVHSIRPLILIFVATGDQYEYQHILNLKAEDITKNIDLQEEMEALFSSTN